MMLETENDRSVASVLSEVYRSGRTIKYGKYKGQSYESLPEEYLAWAAVRTAGYKGGGPDPYAAQELLHRIMTGKASFTNP